MFIKVRLLNGYKNPLLYEVPSQWPVRNLCGAIVRVPLRSAVVSALVEECVPITKESFHIKRAISYEKCPDDPTYYSFIQQVARYYNIDSIFLIKRLQQFFRAKKCENIQIPFWKAQNDSSITLTNEQQIIVDACVPYIINARFQPALLHGVTGSGKTEVYKQLIIAAIQNKKTVLLLLPEVTLAVQFAVRLTTCIPEVSIFSFHSAISRKERRMLWDALCAHQPILIIGVHLPIFLPIYNLGLIIIDEEHSVGYQEKKHPKINSKDMALLRASRYKIPIILGSATPSVNTFYMVRTRKWHYFRLQKRYQSSFSTMRVVPLNDKKERKSFWITQPLYNALKKRLAAKEQSIIFLNRRGYCFFVQCATCGFVFQCVQCTVSLTLHDSAMLLCHYCGFSAVLPTQCTACKETQFLKKGVGTQQIVSILNTLFPHACIVRADMDSTINKKRWQATIADMLDGKIDILVGTQTITKGYHFPNVTLVGILWADANLNFPLYNAFETTVQQIIQVAGRAGRAQKMGEVVVQTMMDPDSFSHFSEENYIHFIEQELMIRKKSLYPPFVRLVEIELKNDDEYILNEESHTLALYIKRELSSQGSILGPVKPLVHKIQNIYSRKLYIKIASMDVMMGIYQSIPKKEFSSSLFFTPQSVA